MDNKSDTYSDKILDGMDTLLGFVEESTFFHQEIVNFFSPKVKNALLQVIKFGELDRESFFTLSEINPQDFETFFRSIDFSSASKKLGLSIPDNFLKIASGEFRASIVACISRYEIYKCLDNGNVSTKFETKIKTDEFSIHISRDTGEHYLQIGSEVYQEINLRDDYYESENNFLFFCGALVTHYYNTKTGELTSITGELEDTYIISGKTYIQSCYPSCDNPKYSEVHCVEDDFTYQNTISENAGFILGLTEQNGNAFVIESGYFCYNGFYKGEEREKAKNQVIVRNLYTGEILNEQNGKLERIISVKNGSVIVTKCNSIYQEGENTLKNIEKYEASFYQKKGVAELEGFELSFPARKVERIIVTKCDVIIICNDTKGQNIEENNFKIVSIVGRNGIGEGITESSVLGYKIREVSDDGVIIDCFNKQGETNQFKSQDYFPSSFDYEISGYFH